MNVIVIMNDSLRRDHINAYGVPAPWSRPGHEGEAFIDTPSLDRLAAQSAIFERCYIASYPTVPNRRDLFTGRWGLIETGWEPLRPDDVLISEVLGRAGIVTQLYFDTLPMGGAGYNFMRGFDGWEWVRGQHGDQWVTAPYPVELPAPLHMLRGNAERMGQILRNSYMRRYERDHMAAHTLRSAIDWLEENHTHDGFFLWVDTWDPHEPFDPPPYDYRRYADPDYVGPAIIYPQYGRPGYLTEAELNDIRARYAGEVTMVDRSVGYLLDMVHALGLDENTVIIHITDHGYLMGEHDLLGKPGDLLGNLYEPTCHVGMLIRHPEGLAAGQRIPAIVQPPDLTPTILELLSAPIPDTVQGRSLLPLLRGEADQHHALAISGRFIWEEVEGVTDTSFQFDGMAGSRSQVCARTVTTERWSYICAPYEMQSELYDLRVDPQQLDNVIEDYPHVARELRQAMLDRLAALGTAEYGLAPFRSQL
ncbi:MAG: sulfatase [Anaerolineae bacterium]|nr:sulfatase [Anaerolineae bacterium]